MPNPNAPHTPLNADVGVTYTAGMHDQLVAQVLLTYARGGDCAALGVPHHVDPNPNPNYTASSFRIPPCS